MEMQHIIDEYKGSTEWLNNVVIREKGDDRLYICLYLLLTVFEQSYQKVTPANTYYETTDTKYMLLYSILLYICKEGYWNVKLHAAVSLMTTFYTPFRG